MTKSIAGKRKTFYDYTTNLSGSRALCRDTNPDITYMKAIHVTEFFVACIVLLSLTSMLNKAWYMLAVLLFIAIQLAASAHLVYA